MQPGNRIAHFEIIARIGAGGMGEIYRARDTRLGRDVAIKVLPAEFASDPDRLRRFEREAKATAALSHPNILDVHDVGTTDGEPFLVEELLEGESLAERLAKGALPAGDALVVAVQIARGLAAAHEKGIVHRDLKPANVFLTTRGVVKVLDFGLAKEAEAVPVREVETLTHAPTGATEFGRVLGTVAYMAPEQARGMPVDPRADVFALGIVLYEMVAGAQPFHGKTAADTVAAILKGDPAPLPAAVPSQLASVIQKCLRKEQDERYRNAGEVLAALESAMVERAVSPWISLKCSLRRRPWLAAASAAAAIAGLVGGYVVLVHDHLSRGGPPPTPDRRCVLVLPFENRTGDPHLDTVGAMSADWIIQGLSETGIVRVIPLATSLAYGRQPGRRSAAGGEAEERTWLGKELGAGTVVSGAYYLSGGVLQVQATVYDAGKNSVLGAIGPTTAPADQPLGAVERLRERVMATIAMALDPRSAPIAAVIAPLPSYEAYQVYIAAMERFIARDFRGAMPLFQRVAATNASFAHARLLAAYCQANLSDFPALAETLRELAGTRDRLPELDRAILEELEARLRGDTAGQVIAARRAAELAPLSGQGIELGRVLLFANRPREAIEVLGRFKRDSPIARDWLPYWRVLAISQHLAGDYAGELRTARAGREIHPDLIDLVGDEGDAVIGLGRLDELERLSDQLLALPGEAHARAGSVMLGWAQELVWHGHVESGGVLVQRTLTWLNSRPDQERRAAANRAALAFALFLADRPSEAATELADLTSERPDDVAYMTLLGIIAARSGDRHRAGEVEQWLEHLDRPYLFGEPARGRAAIAAWLGETGQAVSLLREAIAQGQQTFEMHADFRLHPLWTYAPFQDLLKPAR